MKIIPFDNTHIEDIAALEQQCFAIPWSRDMFLEELANDMAVYFVAQTDGEVVGYAGMWHVCGEGHITNIAVSPSHRRSGIGRLLLGRLIDSARIQDMHVMFLEVRASNAAAIALYENHGFIRAGLRKGYYADNGEDAVLMSLPLR